MSQQANFNVPLNEGTGGKEWESYRYGDNYIFWSEDFHYHIVTQSGSHLKKGQLAEKLPEKELPLTQPNCYWFTKMSHDRMLYAAFNDENNAVTLKEYNLTTNETKAWCADAIPCNRSMFHNFAWLNYYEVEGVQHVQFAWLNESKTKYAIFKDGKQVGETHETDLNNPNCFYVEHNYLYTACNFVEPKGINMYVFTPTTVNKVKFEFNADSAYTWQDFGKIDNKWMYITVIEGEAGNSKKLGADKKGHTAGVLLLDTANYNFETHTEVIKEDALEWHWLDKGDSDEEKEIKHTDLPDGFYMVNRQTKSLFATCSNGRFVMWDFKFAEGVTTVTKSSKDDNRFNLNNYCSSWDREGLWAWNLVGDTMQTSVHTKANPKIQYFWLLMGVTKANTDNSVWYDTDLNDGLDLLVE